MQSHGIQTPACKVASTPEEAEDAFLNTLNQRTYHVHLFVCLFVRVYQRRVLWLFTNVNPSLWQ